MVHVCDENGCDEKATSMVKILMSYGLMSYGLYCGPHAEQHQAKAHEYHQSKVRRGR